MPSADSAFVSKTRLTRLQSVTFGTNEYLFLFFSPFVSFSFKGSDNHKFCDARYIYDARVSARVFLWEPRIFEGNVESATYPYSNGIVARSSADDIDEKSDDDEANDDYYNDDDKSLNNDRCDKRSRCQHLPHDG